MCVLYPCLHLRGVSGGCWDMKSRIVSQTSVRMGTWHLQKAWQCLKAGTPAIGNNRFAYLDQKWEDDVKQVTKALSIVALWPDSTYLTPKGRVWTPFILTYKWKKKKEGVVNKYICPKDTMITVKIQLRVNWHLRAKSLGEAKEELIYPEQIWGNP